MGTGTAFGSPVTPDVPSATPPRIPRPPGAGPDGEREPVRVPRGHSAPDPAGPGAGPDGERKRRAAFPGARSAPAPGADGEPRAGFRRPPDVPSAAGQNSTAQSPTYCSGREVKPTSRVSVYSCRVCTAISRPSAVSRSITVVVYNGPTVNICTR